MHHSSKVNPCPICGRNTDDKCRWNEELFFCYQGSEFSPPDLHPGETYDHPELGPVACLSASAGFSGASSLLCLDRPLAGAHGAALADAKMKRADEIRQLRSFTTWRIIDIRKNLINLNRAPTFLDSTFDQIDFYRVKASQVKRDAEFVLAQIRSKRAKWEGVDKCVMILNDTIAQASYSLNDVDSFINHYLN